MPQCVRFAAALAVLLLTSSPALAQKKGAAEPAQDTTKLPWALREHYTFGQGNSALMYAEDNAEWQIRMEGVGEVLAGALFRVQLADGTVLSRENLKRAGSRRDKYDADGLSGNHYTVTFTPSHGAEVTHRLTSPQGMPGFLFRVGVRNTGDTPIAIQRVEPVVVPPGALAKMPAGTTLALRRPDSRAGYVYAGNKDRPTLAVFSAPNEAFSLVLGMFGTGAAEVSAQFTGEPGAWSGALAGAYAPARVLKPGEEMLSDPAWVCASITDLNEALNYHAHLFGLEPRAAQSWNLPKVWAAAPAESNYQDALDYARKIQGAGVSHVVLPAVWESPLGSLKGGAQGYPGNMATAAKALTGASVTPGLALDPLAVSAAAAPGEIFTDANGVGWANPMALNGRRAVAGRFAVVKQWGFDFAVCEHSAIPDAALEHFGISRTQAEREALAIACALAGDGPRISPPALSAAESTLDDLLEHAGQVGHLGNMAIMPTPLRVSGRGIQSLDGNLLLALRLWPGPIEIVGQPGNGASAGIAQLARAGYLQAKPIDAASEIPRLWQVRVANSKIGYTGAAVAAFPGAPAWDLAALKLGGDIPLGVWRASNGELLDAATDIPAATTFEYYGVTPLNGHPTFMGTSQGPTLGMDRLKQLAWDDAALTLSGELDSGIVSGTTAYVYVPGAFQLRDTKVGGRSVNAKAEGGRVAFGLGSGSEQRFELRFERP